MFVCFYYSVSILFLFIAMRLNAYKLICLYYNSKHPCKLSCSRFSFAFCRLWLWLLLLPLLPSRCVCYAIVSAPCSVNAERQKQQHEERIAERRQGNARRACPALPDCLCYRCIIYHYVRACLQGDRPPPAGGTFSVRFDGGKGENRSCSSPQPLVLTF